MVERKKILTLRLINTVFFAIAVLFQYNGVFKINILTANPMLPLALLVACCMFSSELTAAFTGLAVGIFTDSVSSTPAGFNAILLMVTALTVCLISKHLFNNNIFAAFTLCFFCIRMSQSFAENLTYLMRYALPSAVYTAVFIIPLYFLEKYLYNKFYFLHRK